MHLDRTQLKYSGWNWHGTHIIANIQVHKQALWQQCDNRVSHSMPHISIFFPDSPKVGSYNVHGCWVLTLVDLVSQISLSTGLCQSFKVEGFVVSDLVLMPSHFRMILTRLWLFTWLLSL
mmetsp:Transcript_35379/g.63241  ORF Transcript_35379/g.63241 Transcript_35379/m.63241 type:complete len:120 (-) Transcript_35379:58-417(-)